MPEGCSVSAATALDPDAADFGYLVEANHNELFRLALLLTGGDRFLTEEAVSHAFVATLPKWRKGEPATNQDETRSMIVLIGTDLVGT
jgi:hypothetical protein